MAATTSGAVKAYLEGLAFGVPVFRDGPRDGQAPPFIVVTEASPVGLDAAGNGDYGDPDTPLMVNETVTVDLVQNARLKVGGAQTRSVERYGLAEAVAHALNACTLPAHPAPVTAVRVTGMDRYPIADNRIRHSIQLAVHRQLLTSEVTPA